MVEVSINGNGKLFLSAGSAKLYSDQELKKFLITEFRNFVLHKKMLFEFGDGSFYRRKRKIESLDKCLKYVEYLPECTTIGICKIIQKAQPLLEHILPSPGNSSYGPQKEKIQKLLAITSQYITAKE